MVSLVPEQVLSSRTHTVTLYSGVGHRGQEDGKVNSSTGNDTGRTPTGRRVSPRCPAGPVTRGRHDRCPPPLHGGRRPCVDDWVKETRVKFRIASVERCLGRSK